MKKPSRQYISAFLIFALIFAVFHIIPAPVDGAGSLGGFVVKEAVKGVKELLKKGNLLIGTLTGKFDRIHKSVERAVDWIKNNKLSTAEGLYVAYDASTHIMTVIDGGYSVEFVPDDENELFNIYVNDEDCGVLVYEIIENCSEEQIAEKFSDAKENTIAEYKSRHR